MIFLNRKYCVSKILNVSRSVCKPYLRASYHVYKIGYLLVRDISLPAAQLSMIAIESILRGGKGGGQFNYIEDVAKTFGMFRHRISTHLKQRSSD